MVYENGASCWNGPQRSTKVHLICKAHASILKVEEPNKCEYKMLIGAPVFCKVLPGDRLSLGAINDEL